MSNRKRLTLCLAIVCTMLLIYLGTTRRPSSKQIDTMMSNAVKYPGVNVYPPDPSPDPVSLKDLSREQDRFGPVSVSKTVTTTTFNTTDMVSTIVYDKSKQRIIACERKVAFPKHVVPCNRCPLITKGLHPLLPKEAIKSVETFILFIGFSRSGSSILGALLDAHPHVVLSNEYLLISKVATGNSKDPVFNDRRTLFSVLYNRQRSLLNNSLINPSKGYSLYIQNSYMGTYKDTIAVVGDKSGAYTNFVHLGNKSYFFEIIEHLGNVVKAPIKFINPVRNPFDIIATQMLYGLGGKELRAEANTHKIILDPKYIDCKVKQFEKEIWSIVEICKSQRYEVLHVHLEDLVESPRVELLKICNFLGVSCPEDYISACTDKIFKETSKTRHSIEWPNEALDKVHSIIQSIPYLKRYSFYS